jgi:hypothetical protein
VILAVADFVASTCETAVTLTANGVLAVEGAVYSPLEEMIPTVELPPATPPAFQVIAVFELPETVAVNCCVCPSCKSAVGGETETATSEVIVTPALAISAVFAWDSTVTVTVFGLGTVEGGV